MLFISGMAQLNDGDATACADAMSKVVENYPESGVSPIAGMILNGIREGRKLHGGKFDLGDMWTQRTALAASVDSTAADTLSAERDTPHVLILAFNPSEVDANKVLFAVGKYNFTSFMVRSFDMRIEETEGAARLVVSGFLNYDEAAQYLRRLAADKGMAERLKGCRRVVVSEKNMPLLGTHYSYDDYDLFFIRTLAPVKVSDEQLLNLPETIVTATPPDEVDAPEEDDDGEEQSDDPDYFDFDEDFYR